MNFQSISQMINEVYVDRTFTVAMNIQHNGALKLNTTLILIILIQLQK